MRDLYLIGVMIVKITDRIWSGGAVDGPMVFRHIPDSLTNQCLSEAMQMRLEKIISGGQTGADQGGLDGAIACGIPHGGAIPAGRKTEAGMLPLSYEMTELGSDRYNDRTERNVIDGDGTLILSHGPLTGGSALTEKIALRLEKPCLHIDFNRLSMNQAYRNTAAWIEDLGIKVLNVAGPRASSDPTIYTMTRELIILLLEGAAE